MNDLCPRILLEPGSFNGRNMGDVAMLQVAVARLEAGCPGAKLTTFTNDPDELARHCPSVASLSTDARRLWFGRPPLASWFMSRAPARLARAVTAGRRRAWHAAPEAYRRLLRAAAVVDGPLRERLAAVTDALESATLFVVAGQATLTDADRERALLLFDVTEALLDRGTPVAWMGQGLGPMEDAELRARAAAVLGASRLIAVRESRSALPLLEELGVPRDRVVVTGDDAVEPAFAARPAFAGTGLGVHLRRAPLAIRDEATLQRIRPVLHAAAARHGTTLVPLPISHHRYGAYDPATIAQVSAGFHCVADASGLDTPAAVMAAAGQCRVVVSGAYHAAVFALAQGVPVVCLGASRYYLDKFHGLAEQFDGACTVLHLEAPDLPARLGAAVDRLWTEADDWRPRLLAAAERQIAAGREAYRRLLAVAEASGAQRSRRGSSRGGERPALAAGLPA